MARRTPRLRVPLVALTAMAAAVLVFTSAARVADTYSDRQWVRFLATRPLSAAAVRQAARHAVRGLERGAPLPAAREGAAAAIEMTHRLVEERPQAALEVAAQLRSKCESLESSWRGTGLSFVTAAARLVEVEARAVAWNHAESGGRGRR